MEMCLSDGRFGFGYDHPIEARFLDAALSIGLAKCEGLPFDDESQDVVFSSFVLDRLADPVRGMMEMMRVVRPQGQIIIVSPINYQSTNHWRDLFPAVKLNAKLISLGLEIRDWQANLLVSEPMDANGNCIQ